MVIDIHALILPQSVRRFSNSAKKRIIQQTLIKFILLLVTTAVFGFIYYSFYSRNLYTPFYRRGDYVVIALFFMLYAVFSKLYGGFNLTVSRASELVYSLIITDILTHFFMYLILWLLIRYVPNVLPLLLCLVCCILISSIWAAIAVRITNRVLPPYRTLLIFDNKKARLKGEQIIRNISWRFSLCGEIDASGRVDTVLAEIRRQKPTAVLICGVPSTARNDILKYCIEKDILAYLRPNIGDFIMNGARSIQLSNLPVMLCQRSSPSLFYSVGKRAFDIVLGILGVILLSPIMLITAISIKLYDHGPVLYRQERLTKNRRTFFIYKFRSMRVDAEKDGVARLASKDDSRITPVGKVIRFCRFDELPQLLNIIGGSMSIVGPRPERPEIARLYEESIPEFSLRLQVKAGLTGYAQVYGRYNTSPYDKLQMDLYYISNQSFATDLKIIFATIKVLFMPESTSGVEKGEKTALK